MKILLVNPFWVFYPGTNKRPGGPPSTMAILASVFQQRHVDVSVYDFMASDNHFHDGDTLVYGKDIANFISYLASDSWDAIGFTDSWTVQHPNVERLIRLVRHMNNDQFVFVGGHHATITDDYDTDINLRILGEIEPVIDDVLDHIENRTDGIVGPVLTQNLDDLPIPAYDTLDLKYYLERKRNHHGSMLLGGVQVVTSRGCPHMCNFCTVHLSMGRKWRANSPDYVLEMLHDLYFNGFTNIHFEDDNVMVDMPRWIEIMERMALHSHWQWDTPNGVRLNHLTDDVLELAAKSGCKEFRIAIETSNDEIRNNIVHKNLDIDNVYHVAEKCHDLGIVLSSFYMVGMPGETLDDMRNTLRLASKLEDEYYVVPRYSIATPFPKTQLLHDCLDNGWLDVSYPYTVRQLAGGTHLRGLIRTDDFGPEDINKIYAAWKRRTL